MEQSKKVDYAAAIQELVRVGVWVETDGAEGTSSIAIQGKDIDEKVRVLNALSDVMTAVSKGQLELTADQYGMIGRPDGAAQLIGDWSSHRFTEELQKHQRASL